MSETNQGTLPVIRNTIQLNAPIQKVWDAVATSEGIATWFMPNDFQPVLGNEFALEGPFGKSPCKVTELDPPNKLVFTWGQNWIVTFELHETEAGKTEFTLLHDGWEAGKVLESGEEASAVRAKMAHGWEVAVLPRLVEYVQK
ncbi:polyketide cyclase [Tumebacillus avium]|uniref:Polyketide cyclase n=1 Tax=Tumebacillus avium TaxID=1903704 RepID=A0A1Y0IN25_9BACL|nr:SRPBCC domain-containing protein [Tumebacillus avium]ARU60753.1 polyketide cyclase [Tumebacillus avium]